MTPRHKHCDTLILGGGLTGLWAARACVKAGQRPVIIEQSARTGGLAKTLSHNGRKFDLGGHRIYFSSGELLDEVISLIGREEMLFLDRKSSIFTGGKLLRYPPTIADGAKMGFKAVRTIIASLTSRRGVQPKTLRDWVIARFGKDIHDIYFRDYSEKVWGLPTDRISAQWADKRIGNFDAIDLLKQALVRRKTGVKENITEFAYPRHGIGVLCEALERDIFGKASIITRGTPSAFTKSGGRLTGLDFETPDGPERLTFDRVISTIPMRSLLRLTDPEHSAQLAAGLEYRALILVFLCIKGPKLSEDHWVYIPDKEIVFSRITEFDNWGLQPSVQGERTLSCELFCDRDDSLWATSDDEIIRRTTADLRKFSPFGEGAVKAAFVERVPFAYPLFYLGYENALSRVKNHLSGFANLSLAGRQGRHMYYDMEECILSAEAAAK